MPPEVPHALNAPPGALIYYYLGAKPGADIRIEVTDRSGEVVRHYSSTPIPAEPDDKQPITDFWKEIVTPLPTAVGTNRMNWDLRYDNPPTYGKSYDISATPFLTPASPQGPLVAPGDYTITLYVDGQKLSQAIKVVNDPRSPASASDVRAQHELQMVLYHGDVEAMASIKQVAALKTKISAAQGGKLPKDVADALSAFADKVNGLGGSTGRRSGFGFGGGGGGAATPTFDNVQSRCISYLAKMEFGDMAPSQPVRDAVSAIARDLGTLRKAWKAIQAKDLPEINAKLVKAGAQPLSS